MLILKGLKRLLETLGVLKKPENADAYADVDKYEACATAELKLKDEGEGDGNEGGSVIQFPKDCDADHYKKVIWLMSKNGSNT